jgi:hypothetical protein
MRSSSDTAEHYTRQAGLDWRASGLRGRWCSIRDVCIHGYVYLPGKNIPYLPPWRGRPWGGPGDRMDMDSVGDGWGGEGSME